MRNRALTVFFCFSWSILCLESVKIREVFRRRRQTCDDGTYRHGEIDCCRCPVGHYIKEHCTRAGTSGKCELCGPGYYRDRPNSEENCEPCTACQEQSNRRVMTECTRYANRVCTCLDDYYCDQGDKCTVCHRCDQCQDSSVKVACTATNNTVCSKKEEGSNVAGIVAGIVIPAVAAAAIIFYLKHKKIFCFSQPPPPPEQPEEEEPLQDVNLTPMLSDIAEKLGWRVVKGVTTSLVTPVEVDNIQHDHPNDTAEQTEQLLRRWYQKYGFEGAYNALVQRLNQKGYKNEANEVKRIVEERNISA